MARVVAFKEKPYVFVANPISFKWFKNFEVNRLAINDVEVYNSVISEGIAKIFSELLKNVFDNFILFDDLIGLFANYLETVTYVRFPEIPELLSMLNFRSVKWKKYSWDDNISEKIKSKKSLLFLPSASVFLGGHKLLTIKNINDVFKSKDIVFPLGDINTYQQILNFYKLYISERNGALVYFNGFYDNIYLILFAENRDKKFLSTFFNKANELGVFSYKLVFHRTLEKPQKDVEAKIFSQTINFSY